MKKHFQMYAEELQKQLKEVSVDSVKVDVSTAAVKHKSTNWIISSWSAIQEPMIAINGFKKSWHTRSNILSYS